VFKSFGARFSVILMSPIFVAVAYAKGLPWQVNGTAVYLPFVCRLGLCLL
jgi:hypothetical protein